MEGDSQVIINIARRLQQSASTSQISKNWRWEGRLSELKWILAGLSAILFSHVRRSGNKVADALENEGVENHSSFHAEELDDNGNIHVIWEWCGKLVKEDMGGRIETNNCQTHPNLKQVEDSCHSNSMRINPFIISLSSNRPSSLAVEEPESCDLSQSTGGVNGSCT